MKNNLVFRSLSFLVVLSLTFHNIYNFLQFYIKLNINKKKLTINNCKIYIIIKVNIIVKVKCLYS